jgi:Bacterial mobilisation protein (MobC)
MPVPISLPYCRIFPSMPALGPRCAAFARRPKPHAAATTSFELVEQLRHVGVNLNQVARLSHIDAVHHAELAAPLIELRGLLALCGIALGFNVTVIVLLSSLAIAGSLVREPRPRISVANRDSPW